MQINKETWQQDLATLRDGVVIGAIENDFYQEYLKQIEVDIYGIDDKVRKGISNLKHLYAVEVKYTHNDNGGLWTFYDFGDFDMSPDWEPSFVCCMIVKHNHQWAFARGLGEVLRNREERE